MPFSINFTSPVKPSRYLPIQIMSNAGTISIEGNITPAGTEVLNPHPKRAVTAWDNALEIKLDSDFYAPLDFLVDRIPSAPGKRTAKVKTPLSVAGAPPEDTVDFLAMPRRLRMDFTAMPIVGGTCTVNPASCKNAKRVFYLEHDATLAYEMDTAGTLSKTEVWLQNIRPKVCKCHSIRLEVTTTQGVATGIVRLWIKPVHSAPESLRIVRYENSAWNYSAAAPFPIRLDLEAVGTLPTNCSGWSANVDVYPA